MSIRMARETDAAAMLAIYTPYVSGTTVSFEFTPPTPEQFSQRLREHLAQCPWLVWEEAGRVLGYAYGGIPFSRAAYAWCAEASIYLAAEARGRGIGAQLYAQLERLLQLQGYEVIYAIISGENQSSIRFHARQGYRQVARFPRTGFKFGRWLDTVWMEKRIGSVAQPEQAPLCWQQLPPEALDGLL